MQCNCFINRLITQHNFDLPSERNRAKHSKALTVCKTGVCHCATDWCLCLAGRHCRWLLGVRLASLSRCHSHCWRCWRCCICFLAINVACSRRSHCHQRLQFLCLLHSLSLARSLTLSRSVLSAAALRSLPVWRFVFCALVLVCAVGVVEECLGGNVNALPLLLLLPVACPALLLTLSVSLSVCFSVAASSYSVHFLQGAVAVAIQTPSDPPPSPLTRRLARRIEYDHVNALAFLARFPHDSSLRPAAEAVASREPAAMSRGPWSDELSSLHTVMKKNPKTSCGCFSTFVRSSRVYFFLSFFIIYLITFAFRSHTYYQNNVEFSLLIG